MKLEIEQFVKQNKIRAAVVLTCVGSLTQANLRFANQPEGITRGGFFEIVSLTGMVGASGTHMHISIADDRGRTTGGHLLAGCIIYTTAEIALAELPDLEFIRMMDEQTGYKELIINQLSVKLNAF